MKKGGNSKAKTPRELALHLLARVERKGAYADRLLSSLQVLVLERRDRLFLRELVLGVLRWKLRLDHIIDSYYTNTSGSLQHNVRMIVRLGLYQMIFMDSVPDRAAVNESVEIAARHYGKKTAGLVNALLRRFSREGEPEISSSEPVEKLGVEYSFPQWIVERWLASYGAETAEAIMKAGNEKHPVSIRTNATKIDSELLAKELSKEGFEASVSSGMQGYLTVFKGDGIFGTSAFTNGLFAVQDAASAMAALLLSPEAGDVILDCCSAPGGKTTHCAEIAGDDAKIDALDINPGRLDLVKKAAKRLGLRSIHCFEGDAVTFKSETDTHYDRILCDVPCTGTGVFSKRPDMKWRKEAKDVARMASLQKSILDNAASLVKPGGVIVYSTCSLEPEENEDIVKRFIHEHDFSVEKDDRFKNFEIEGGYLILPQLMDGTGAFASKLRRI